jgi:hypothetical protein
MMYVETAVDSEGAPLDPVAFLADAVVEGAFRAKLDVLSREDAYALTSACLNAADGFDNAEAGPDEREAAAIFRKGADAFARYIKSRALRGVRGNPTRDSRAPVRMKTAETTAERHERYLGKFREEYAAQYGLCTQPRTATTPTPIEAEHESLVARFEEMASHQGPPPPSLADVRAQEADAAARLDVIAEQERLAQETELGRIRAREAMAQPEPSWLERRRRR